MSKLVIVESPSKAKNIGKYLGKNYHVVACMGHVRDLPKSQLGVDVEHGFAPKYISIRGKAELINGLKKQAKASDKVLLAADPDREGEAISWHLAHVLGLKEDDLNRVTFNEITKTAVKEGIKHPRKIDLNLVNAQQARRILDRLVGYKLSPFLWKKVRPGLSAGRVQSVAVRIIVDRENEILRFVPEEYWTIDAQLETEKKERFTARFYGDKNGKMELKDKESTDRVLSGLEGVQYLVGKVKKGTKTRNPAPPFTTSTLQQEASRKLNFQSKKTMATAQALYEGMEIKGYGAIGLITYMRTDSLRISAEAAAEARSYIGEKYGEAYVPESVRAFKSRASAQDAHEAIRPTVPSLTPAMAKPDLTNDQYKLYKLIWERFIACQMKAAVYDTTQADILAGEYVFKASGSSVKFPGFTVLYEEGRDEKVEEEKTLPPLREQDALTLLKLGGEQHFTQPPARYTEATLIKALEENGIGRPSTYAPTISTILQRGYVNREGKALYPTPLGIATNQLMCEHFKDIVDVNFTANMEHNLDEVAAGELGWVDSLDSFYRVFSNTLSEAEKTMGDTKVQVEDEVTDIVCEKCGRNMVIKQGRYGKFLACPGYPECKNTRQLGEKTPPEISDVKCELCGRPMAIKQGRYGKFLACTGYPECKNTKQINKETAGVCPKCGAKLAQRYTKRGKAFYGCTKYPECDFVSWDEPTEEKCPQCGSTLFKKRVSGGFKLNCHKEGCGYTRTEKDEAPHTTDTPEAKE